MESSKSPISKLFDVDSGRIFIVIVNTKECHSDVLARVVHCITGSMVAFFNTNCDNCDLSRLLKPLEMTKDRMSMPTQWEQMGMHIQYDMLCDIFVEEEDEEEDAGEEEEEDEGKSQKRRDRRRRPKWNQTLNLQTFLACNPRDYDRKGGAVTHTMWIEKMEYVIENSGCAKNQKVKYAAILFINKALTWWNTQVQERGREAAIGYTDWFHELAKLVPHLVTPESKRIERYINELAPQIHGMLRATQPTMIHSVILKAGILTDEAVRCGTLTRSSEKRKKVEVTSKQGEGGLCRLCYNFQKPGHFARDYRASVRQVPLVSAVRKENNQRNKSEIVCHEKVVRIPLEGGEVIISLECMRMIFQRLRSERDTNTLSLQLCTFGLTNAPVVFLDLMNRVYKPYLDNFVIVFIDDILIYSKPKEDHEVHLKLVLELLKKEMCHMVNHNGIHVDPSKIKAKYEWGAEQEEAFQTFKDNLCNASILSLPNGIEDFVVYCDASNQGLGCVLMQRGKANIVADALSRKERVKPKRVRAIAMTIQSEVKRMILAVQSGRTIIMDEAHKIRYSVHPGADKMYYDLRDMYEEGYRCRLANVNLHVPLDEIKVEKPLRVVKEPVEIMDREVKSLKCNRIPIVKDQMSTPIQCYHGIDLGSDEYAYSVGADGYALPM
nr:hypothetical protein [Tanacetum cinerariifolium]